MKKNNNVIGFASNGNELFQLLNHSIPDIVLLDLEMPQLNGSKTLNLLKKKFPSIKVIIISRYHDEELIKDMFNRGASGFITKNSELEQLNTAIELIMTDGEYKANISELIKKPAVKDRHYFKLLFTKREVEIIGLLCEALSYDEISQALFISQKTVENHAKSIFRKSGVKNRNEFSVMAIKLGLIYLS